MLVFLLVAPTAGASKGSSFFKEGQKTEAAGNYDLAVTLYQKAYDSDRKNVQYMSALRRTRFIASMKHLDAGHKLREAGKLDEALGEFQKALLLDPSTSIAEQEVGRTLQAIEARKAKVPGAEETLSPQQARQREFEKKMSQAEAPAELMPTTRAPMNFRATNDSKIIFETIGKNFGINVLTDPDYQGKRIPVELVNVTLEQALDYVGILSKTLWAPLTSNTIVIYQDSKRRDREPWVLKTIYLSNTVQPTEITEITQVLRNVVDITKIMQVNAQNAIIIRATPDQIALAEKIINDIDKAKAEVLVDVMVLLVQRDLSRQLGITPVSSGAPGLQFPITFNPGGVASTAATTTAIGTTATPSTTNSGSALTLSQIAKAPLNNYTTVLPGATINAILSDAHTKILQNPQIRASDGQIAKLRVGERVPIATGTFSTGVVATGGLPAAQTSFQYTDVGVIMEITPRVNAGREVSMKVVVEVSAVDSRVNIGGVDQPVIGQRRIEQDIRLKEGEINVLGGIINDSETITRAGVPLLGSIPILGHFFSSEQKTISQSEMLVVLTPHIVRSTDFSDLNLRGIDSGTQASVGLRYKQPPPSPEMVAAARAAAAVAATAAAAAPAGPAPPDVPATGTALRFADTAIDVPMGKDFKVTLEIVNALDVNSVPFQLRFDPKVLKLTSVTAGDFLSKDGQSVSLAPTIDPVAGTATVPVTRPPTATGISGTGKLVTLNFQPVAAGTSKVEVVSASARGPREPKPLPATLMTVTVK